jgi:hypothetical protein
MVRNMTLIYRKWRLLSGADQSLALRMTVFLLILRAGLNLLPWRMMLRVMAAAEKKLADLRPVDAQYRERVAWAVRTAGKVVLGEDGCLPQALAVHFMFRRKGLPAELILGVMKGPEGQLVAHAWVESSGAIATGEAPRDLKRYTRLAVLDEDLA